MEDDSKSVVESVNAQPYSYCTDTKVTTYKHSWKINNFDLCSELDLQSSEYSSDGNEKFKWYWQLTPKSDRNVTTRLTLFVTFPETGIKLISKVKVIEDGMESVTANRRETATPIKCKECLNYTLKSNVKSLIFDIELTIIEDFMCHEGSMPIVQDYWLSNLWTNLLDDKEFSDVVLAVNGKEFLAHKAVLANRSSVFRAMLSHKMVESTENKVTITDIEPKVFEQLLHFIYTDSVSDSDMATMAFDLLQAADKYDLETLKTRCEVALCGQISKETAVNTLVLADLYHAKKLKRAAINFIGRNVGVIQTEDWKKLTLKNFELAGGVMIELLEGTQLK
uniref:Speckle-type POZ protein B n=1 Tax=Culex pipiens TaxID=7175 RepID=A0A8D8DN39_CULPI